MESKEIRSSNSVTTIPTYGRANYSNQLYLGSGCSYVLLWNGLLSVKVTEKGSRFFMVSF